MIIIMEKTATQDNIQAVMNILKEHGFWHLVTESPKIQ